MDRDLIVIGVQRSGTNFIAEILRSAFDVDPAVPWIWKHAFFDEISISDKSMSFLVVVRHPVMWLQSCLLHTPRDLVERRSSFFRDGVDSVKSYAQVYKKFYSGWLEAKKIADVRFIKYEDVLNQGESSISETLNIGQRIDARSQQITKIPMSISFSSDDRARYLDMKCSIEKDVSSVFWSELGDLPWELGYQFCSISFAADFSIRTLAYKLQTSPSELNDENFSRLLSEAPSRFAADGMVLAQLADELAKRQGQINSIKLRADAILAFEREIEKDGQKSGACICQVEAIDKLLSILSELKNGRLEETYRFFEEESQNKSITPKMRSDALFYMSDCENRRGNLASAVELARRAVSNGCRANDDEYPASPWLLHHLAHLLTKSGLLDEAVKYFSEAESLDPNNFRHPYALSVALLRMKLFPEASAAASRAISLRPSDESLAKHAAWCLHQDAAAKMAALDLAAALSAVEQSISLEPDFAPHYYLKAEILDRMGAIEDAVAAAKRACLSRAVAPWHYHFLGHLLKISGHPVEARRAFETAIKLEPNNKHHAKALELCSP